MTNNTIPQPRKQEISKNDAPLGDRSIEGHAHPPEVDFEALLLIERTILLTLDLIKIERALAELEDKRHDY